MAKPKGSRPVAFFDVSEELSRDDLDAAVQKVMKVLGERTGEGDEDADGAVGRVNLVNHFPFR